MITFIIEVPFWLFLEVLTGRTFADRLESKPAGNWKGWNSGDASLGKALPVVINGLPHDLSTKNRAG